MLKISNHAKNVTAKFTLTGVALEKFTINAVLMNSGYSEPISTVPWEFTIAGMDCIEKDTPRAHK